MAALIASLHVVSLWDQYLKLLALIGGGFPGVFALGLLTRRANALGVMIGALTSIAVTWWVQNYTHTSVFLHAAAAIATCVVVGYGMSLLVGRTLSREALRGLTIWDLGKLAVEPSCVTPPARD
jgi:hypothetical protein